MRLRWGDTTEEPATKDVTLYENKDCQTNNNMRRNIIVVYFSVFLFLPSDIHRISRRRRKPNKNIPLLGSQLTKKDLFYCCSTKRIL
jgi:hypothetical protein